MTKVLLIRHGENEYVKSGRLAGRQPGVHLNKNGIEQANRVAESLANTKLAALYTSPLDRTIETASPISISQNLKILTRPGLNELDMGDWQNKTIKQLSKRKLWKVVQKRPSLMKFPNGETFADAQLRIVNEILSLVARHSEKEIIACVGHSDMIKLAIAYFIALPLDVFQRLTISPASISTLHFGTGVTRLINMNFAPPQIKSE
jgi:probable phosphomutase (TIGR03848 family)